MCYNDYSKEKEVVNMAIEKTINFDMDGTIADLYGVENWLEYLQAGDSTPYEMAKPLVKMQVLARMLNNKKRQGFTINVISWLAKNSNPEYDEKVKNAKLNWLKKHLKSVEFDNIFIVEYGTPKQNLAKGFLFDDEVNNRINWKGIAFDVNNIINDLKTLTNYTS
jgi:hypothetical protein